MKNVQAVRETALPASPEPILWSHEALKRFRMIFRAVQQHSQWVESCSGVTCAQLWTLLEISKAPGLKVSELAQAMSIHQSTVSNLLAKLEKKDLVRRERASPDQRVVRLHLTEAGRLLIEQAPDPKRGLLQHALFELPEPVLMSLTRNLDCLIETMRVREDQAAMEPLAISPSPPRD